MTLKVTIQPSNPDWIGVYPTYYTEDDGVIVGPAGELTLVARFSEEDGCPNDFRIYAPGTWRQVDVQQAND